jgi:TetR/AcrR family transcriptional repressor of nem operon
VRYSNDHKAETRKRVLHEAGREVRSKGPAHIAVGAVMKRVGLTHGGFYSHFSSKEELVNEAVDTMFADALDRSDRLAGTGRPQEALRRHIDLYLSPMHRDAPERGCPLPTLAGDIARATPAARERFADGVAMIMRRLTDAVSALEVEEPEVHASAILSQMVGAIALSRVVPRPASDAILANARATLIDRYGLEEAA